jgi:hypothetical protein
MLIAPGNGLPGLTVELLGPQPIRAMDIILVRGFG